MFGSGHILPHRASAWPYIVAAFLIAMPLPGAAHQAPTGWAYPFACCSNRDCREISGADVSERPEGYVIKVTGEVLRYDDKRIRQSPDGVFHWCSIAGKNDSRTICLFVPPRAF